MPRCVWWSGREACCSETWIVLLYGRRHPARALVLYERQHASLDIGLDSQTHAYGTRISEINDENTVGPW
jgi:hypothetical protein